MSQASHGTPESLNSPRVEKGSEYYLTLGASPDNAGNVQKKPHYGSFEYPPVAKNSRTSSSGELNEPLIPRQRLPQPNSAHNVKVIGHLPDLAPFTRPTEEWNQDSLFSVDSPAASSRNSPAGTPVWRLFGSSNSRTSDLMPVEEPRPSFMKRMCHYFRAGSIRGSAFNLCSATLGAGALSIPMAFKKMGLLLGIAMLILGALATLFSIFLLLMARKACQKDSYEDLTVFIFGKKMGVFVELSIIIFCFGTAIVYVVAIGQILEPFLDMGIFPSWVDKTIFTCMFWGIVMLPLSMVEKVNSLTWTSMFGVLSIFYLVFAVIYHSISTVAESGWGQVKLANADTEMLTALPIIMFAFTCQVNVFSVQMELERPTNSRMRRVTKRAIFVCFLVYLGVGVFGYLDFLGDTQDNILKNLALKNITTGKDIIVAVAYLAITMTVVLAYPLNIFPIRFTLDFMLYGKDHESSTLARVIMTALLCGGSLAVALYVPAINIVFQLLGGTSSAFVCFVLPAAFAIKLDLGEGILFKVGVWCLFFGGIAAGAAGTVVSVLDILPKK